MQHNIFLLSLLIACIQAAIGAVVNTEVSRVIDASAALVRVSTEIKATGVGKEYQLIFDNEQVKHLSHIRVSLKGKSKASLPLLAPVANGDYTIYTVQVSSATPVLKVETVFTSLLEPYPKEITQLENQMVLLKDSHYFYSPYATESQKTTIKLASSNIVSFTKLSPSTAKGSSISLGPYTDIAPFEKSALTVHSVNNKPFAKFSTMEREVEVSHWGNVAFEDIYELKHAGAALKGGFSRFEYQAKRGQQQGGPSFRSLMGVLPLQAHDIYYRDQIGNISTSNVRATSSELELELETRFPIFGGWQTQFYIGYSVPTENVLFIDEEGRYNLKFDFFTEFEEVWVEDMEVKVVLPEGCTDIKVTAPYAISQSRTTRFTYLDSELNGGRPVIILKAKNLVEEHDSEVVISYSFQKQRMLFEPLLLVVVYFFFFVLSSIFSRMSFAAKDKME